MATFSDNPAAKIKIDFQDPVSGTKFTEEPFNIDFNVFTATGGSASSFINDINDCMTSVCSLTGASAIAKHIIYDISITD